MCPGWWLMLASGRQYYRTEQEIAKLFKSSGLPMEFTNPFTRDYAAVKGDIAGSDEELQGLINTVSAIEIRVSQAESEISSLNVDVASLNTSVLNLTLQAADFEDRLVIVETDLSSVIADFGMHESAQSAHGATGDIVGTDDYCTLAVGGTVLLAAALTPSPTSTLVVTNTPTAPSGAYVQAEAITWVNTINELKTEFNALILEYNQLVAKVNDIISTQETAKQRDA
jgi:hypothetical protein